MIVTRLTPAHQAAFLRMLEDYDKYDPKNGEFYGRGREDFPAYVQRLDEDEQGIALPPNWVPCSHRWLLDEAGDIVGIVRIRHNINTPYLAEEAGHIGYDVPPSFRGKKYAITCLQVGLEVARTLQVERVLVCADTDNPASWRTIEHCGGVLEAERFSQHYQKLFRRYWIETGVVANLTDAMFSITEAWKSAFPGAHVGVLAMKNVINPASHASLEQRKEALVNDLRSRYGSLDRGALENLPSLKVYQAYYKRFKKTYHVQLQLESIVFKGKSIPSVAALVEAMFMAEVKNMLLTAGHDFDVLRLPILLDVTMGNEVYTLMSGQPQQVKPGDMMISDGQGIMSNIIYGPDQRTQIRPGTRSVIYTTYAPAGIREEAITQHLLDMHEHVHLFAPQAQTDLLQVFG